MDQHPDPAPRPLPTLPAGAFRKSDAAPDVAFYRQPRFVTHIDAGAIAAVTALYRELLPAGGDIFDMMSSWVSHLPPEVAYRGVTGLGMNAEELAANPPPRRAPGAGSERRAGAAIPRRRVRCRDAVRLRAVSATTG